MPSPAAVTTGECTSPILPRQDDWSPIREAGSSPVPARRSSSGSPPACRCRAATWSNRGRLHSPGQVLLAVVVRTTDVVLQSNGVPLPIVGYAAVEADMAGSQGYSRRMSGLLACREGLRRARCMFLVWAINSSLRNSSVPPASIASPCQRVRRAPRQMPAGAITRACSSQIPAWACRILSSACSGAVAVI